MAQAANGQHSPTPDELKQQTELANAQKAAIQAQIDLETARRTLDALQHPDPTKAASDAAVAAAVAQKAVSDAQTAAANSSKATSEAETAALKAKIGDVPASGYSGSVELKDKAGNTEAALLAARAIDTAAVNIIKRPGFGSAINAKDVWVFALADLPSFNSLLVYKSYSFNITKALKDAKAEADAKLLDAHVDEGVGANFAPAAIGLGLDAANKLLSFFKSDYTAGGVDVSYDDTSLVHSISGKLIKGWEYTDDTTKNKVSIKASAVQIPSLFNQAALSDSGQQIFSQLTGWALQVGTNEARSKHLQDLAKKYTTDAAGEAIAANKDALLKKAAACIDAVSSLAKGKATYDTVIAKLTTADDKGVVPLVSTVRESTIYDLINRADPGRVLLVKVQKSGGAYYTRKNLWTIFGGMPLWHMGGTVVSFVLLGDKGNVLDAALIPVHGGFVRASKLQGVLDTPVP